MTARERITRHPECWLALALAALTFGMVALHLVGAEPGELTRAARVVVAPTAEANTP